MIVIKKTKFLLSFRLFFVLCVGLYSIGTVYSSDPLVELKQKLENTLKINGPNDLKTARVHHRLGVLYTRRKQLVKAAFHLKGSLEIRVAKLSKNHIKIARAYSAIAFLSHKQNQYPKAITNFENEIAIYNAQDNPSQYNLKLASAYFNMGEISVTHKKYVEALDYFEDSLEYREKHQNPDMTFNPTYNYFTRLYALKKDLDTQLLYSDKIKKYTKTITIGKIVTLKITDANTDYQIKRLANNNWLISSPSHDLPVNLSIINHKNNTEYKASAHRVKSFMTHSRIVLYRKARITNLKSNKTKKANKLNYSFVKDKIGIINN